jgi:Zn-dependent protease
MPTMNAEVLLTLEWIFVLATAIILHEYAHGWAALKLGDPTAKLLGRLTLNPIKHIDPIGTLVVPVVTTFTLGFPFGWAKPVPVNFANLRNPKRDMILVAAAGPAINIIIALIASFFLPFGPQIFSMAVQVNLMLAIFNMIPIPPLDGSRVVAGLLPTRLARKYLYLEPFGFIILIILIQTNSLDFMYRFVLALSSLMIGKFSV